MITKFNDFFDVSSIGWGINGWQYGFMLKKDIFIQHIAKILNFLKEKNIKYHIFHDLEENFYFLFPDLRRTDPRLGYLTDNKKEKRKFSKDEWDKNKVFLPIYDKNNELINGFAIKPLYQDYLENSKEIKIDNLEDVEMFLTANKYNL